MQLYGFVHFEILISHSCPICILLTFCCGWQILKKKQKTSWLWLSPLQSVSIMVMTIVTYMYTMPMPVWGSTLFHPSQSCQTHNLKKKIQHFEYCIFSFPYVIYRTQPVQAANLYPIIFYMDCSRMLDMIKYIFPLEEQPFKTYFHTSRPQMTKRLVCVIAWWLIIM